jgi:hypothetical protein
VGDPRSGAHEQRAPPYDPRVQARRAEVPAPDDQLSVPGDLLTVDDGRMPARARVVICRRQLGACPETGGDHQHENEQGQEACAAQVRVLRSVRRAKRGGAAAAV